MSISIRMKPGPEEGLSNEMFLQILSDQGICAFIVAEDSRRIVSVNDILCKKLGREHSLITGSAVEMLINEVGGSEAGIMQRHFEINDSTYSIYSFKHDVSSEGSKAVRATPPVHTEQRPGKETDLREIFYRGIVESVPDAVLTIDKKGIVTAWNKAAANLFGWTSSEAIGSPVDRLVRSSDQDEISSSEVVNGKVIRAFECLRRGKGDIEKKVSLSVAPIVIHEAAVHIPNLGIATIGAHIDKCHDVFIIDLVRKRNKVHRYLTKIMPKLKPDLIGLSAMAWQYDTCVKIARLIKSLLPQVKIVIGGYHATLMAEEIGESSESQWIDFIVRGEGEEVCRRLVNALAGKDEFKDILSLSYREDVDKRFIHNPRSENLDLETIKPPIRDKRRLTWGYHLMNAGIETLETTRGCTRSCNFCSMKNMYGRTFRTYPISRVLDDIDDIYYNRKVRSIFITDDNMVLNPRRVIELCDAIIAKGYKNIIAYDPLANESFKNSYPELEIQYENTLEAVLEKTDNAVILTGWSEFKTKKYAIMKKNVFDYRYIY